MRGEVSRRTPDADRSLRAKGAYLRRMRLESETYESALQLIEDSKKKKDPERARYAAQALAKFEELALRSPHNRDLRRRLGEIVVKPEPGGDYSPRELVAVVRQVADSYGFQKQKKTVAAMVAAAAVSNVLNVISVSALGTFAAASKFGLGRFLNYRATTAGGDVINPVPQALLQRAMRNDSLPGKLADFLKFSPRVATPDAAAEMLTTIDRSRSASRNLMSGVLANFVGAGLYVAASIVTLAAINPVMGILGLAAIPPMVVYAKMSGKRTGDMRKQENDSQIKFNRELQEVIDNADVLKTSPALSRVSKQTGELLSGNDKQMANRGVKSVTNSIWTSVPFHASAIIAGVVGAYVLHLPLAAIFASMLLTGWIYGPVKQILQQYSTVSPPFVQDIKNMRRILSRTELECAVEKERDKMRVEASSLRDLTVKVRRLESPFISYGKQTVSFTARPGDWVAITGASGSGKTTVMRHLSGLLSSRKEAICLGDTSLQDVARFEDGKRRVLLHDILMYQPQSFKAVGTVRDNLLFGSRTIPSKENETDITEKCRSALDELGLEKYAGNLDSSVEYASGGEKVRMQLARTAFRDPKILLLDEPTAGLDNAARTKVIGYLRRLNLAGTTIICASHDVELNRLARHEVSLDPV